MNRRVLSVLVVDDSAVVRQAVTAVLSQDPGIVVTVAADPYIALDKMGRSRPDVILLDLEMPRMDGLTFLRKIMSEDPIPVVVCSGLASRGTEVAIRALEEGAVEVLAKPQLGVRDFVHDSATTLIETIRAAAEARVIGARRS
jgi:two-component system, chemotaxis family, protein-glutamate methylesterase/glutaminase